MKFKVYGASTPEISDREKAHYYLARTAATEGIVLLKNDGVLPINPGKVALYGVGARMTAKGGTGSGEVHERHSVTIEEGLLNAGFCMPTTLWMDRFDADFQAEKAAWRERVEGLVKGYGPLRLGKMYEILNANLLQYPECKPIKKDELTDETDVAIYVLSRQAGEGGDRHCKKGDYLLTDVEEGNLRILAEHYKKLVLVINTGGIIDLTILDNVPNIGAVIFCGQAGMAGGDALADIISGKVTPSGKLTDTWAMHYEDYPSANTYSHNNGNLEYENYYEGIFVGYRWFDANKIKPRFSFGYGLSYTDFSVDVQSVTLNERIATVKAIVTNTGDRYSGKEVLQLYLSKPNGRMSHERKGLTAFAKTKLLKPKESEVIELSFDLAEQASFDQENGAFVLEAGQYVIWLGNSLQSAKCVAALMLDKEIVTEKVDHICQKKQTFTDFNPTEATEYMIDGLPCLQVKPDVFTPLIHDYTKKPVVGTEKTRRLLEKLNDNDLISLCVGSASASQGYNRVPGAGGITATNLSRKGIPNILFSDGPAGLNVTAATVLLKSGFMQYPGGMPDDWQWGFLKKVNWVVTAKPGKGRHLYHYMTAWPSETVLAQSYNTDLLEEVGHASGVEMREIGVTIWLAPAMNIHRNPLCGRNFEYFSEDPVVSGKMAAAITRGVQSVPGCGVSVKHFCCNNQEDNRIMVSENVSERALRELYLRGFRIVVQEAKPRTVMSSYNQINGVHSPNNYDLITKVLRMEWGFSGLVMSDWNATDQCSHAQAINVGNDLLMPGNKKVHKALKEALAKGELDKECLRTSAHRVLELIFDSAVAGDF